MSPPLLLAIVEMGGYPDFTPLYQRLGYRVEKVHAVRKAQAWLKKNQPAVVVTEFYFDPEFRDRMSNLESLMASLQRYAPVAEVIVFRACSLSQYITHMLTRHTIDGETFSQVMK